MKNNMMKVILNLFMHPDINTIPDQYYNLPYNQYLLRITKPLFLNT